MLQGGQGGQGERSTSVHLITDRLVCLVPSWGEQITWLVAQRVEADAQGGLVYRYIVPQRGIACLDLAGDGDGGVHRLVAVDVTVLTHQSQIIGCVIRWKI